MRLGTPALATAGFLLAISARQALGGEIGHYVGGLVFIRDDAVPDPGFYVLVYNYGYSTDRLNDANGNQIRSVTIAGPGGRLSTTLNIDVSVNLYALAPTIAWVTRKKSFGAKYGLFFAPTFTNASLNALLSRATAAGRSISAGQFNVGDTFVQPIWLGWTGKHYDIAGGYGFYIPSGKYEVRSETLPVIGPVRVEAADNTAWVFG